MMEYATLPSGVNGDFKPFNAHISDEEITSLKNLLDLSRVGPPTYENQFSDRRLGITREWLAKALHTWKIQFDW